MWHRYESWIILWLPSVISNLSHFMSVLKWQQALEYTNSFYSFLVIKSQIRIGALFFYPQIDYNLFSSIWMQKGTPNIWRLHSYDTIYYSELDLFFIMSSTVKTSVSRLHLRIIVILRALYFIQPAHEWFWGRFKQRTCLVW